MKIQNPFESGHIRNYILLYVSVVVIMILFFIASTLFNNVEKVEKKVFDINITKIAPIQKVEKKETRFKLMDKAY